MSKPITNVAIIIETGGPVPTQIQTPCIHSQEEIKNKFITALKKLGIEPAYMEIESGDDNNSIMIFPVETIKMVNSAKIPVEGRIALLHKDEIKIPIPVIPKVVQ